MPASQPKLPDPQPSLSVKDILYIFFRHKWKIVICAVLGVGAAIYYYVTTPVPYHSEAMLYIRYVMDEGMSGLRGSLSSAISTNRGDTVVATEVEILKSMDLAGEVADVLTPEKILSKFEGIKNRDHAAAFIHNNLEVIPLSGSPVIQLQFQDEDPTMVQPVLAQLITAYQKKHVDVHHESAGSVSDFMTQETDQLRSRLSQTEDQLRKAKAKAGVMISMDAAKSLYMGQADKIQQEIFAANAELAERTAILNILKARQAGTADAVPGDDKAPAAGSAKPAAMPRRPTTADVDAYKDVSRRVAALQNYQTQLLSVFTEENQRVKDVRAQMVPLEARKAALDKQYPGLEASLAPPVAAAAAPALAMHSSNPAEEIDAQSAVLAGLQSKIKVLNSQMAEVKAASDKVDSQEVAVAELQRQFEFDVANYKYYSERLEASRVDEALTSGHASNIVEIQAPSPAHIERIGRFKMVAQLAVGGLFLGLAWAFAIEKLFDRSIRRPRDVEIALKAPLFLSIPDFGQTGQNRDLFHETLRDRLIGYFESRGLTHKPKLVAVTGVGTQSGVTTIAAGLARTLSSTGEDNVLLVDMTLSQGSAQHFCGGKPVCGLDAMLETSATRENAFIQDKLYVVGSEPNNERMSRMLPTRFNRIVPQLKASEFDYIIFDMPTVNQISITPRLAAYMDMVLMVVESEVTDQDTARQATDLLASSRAPVGIVLNKTHGYLPKWIDHDFHGSS